MTKFTDNLWSDLTREHRPTLAHADRPEPGRAGGARVLRRPRILAGSTLGLAAVGTALLLALSGSAAPAAFAITKEGDGSVLVKLDYAKDQNLPQVNAKLAARIDAEREGAALMRRCAQLPAVERAAIELVDLEELTPKEAALALGVSRVALRKRLSRARSRLRKEHHTND